MNQPFDLPNVVRDGDVVIGVPIQYAASGPCHRCDTARTMSGAQVYDVWHPAEPAVCRECALLDPCLAPWQHLADAVQAMDAAFIAAGDVREHRQWFADHLVHGVGYMASWRHENDEPITPRF